ncbi:MAG TPA: hypothetical protein VGH97_11855 [Thermoanaerobaculia bacterium]|jgi:hypothetical protein
MKPRLVDDPGVATRRRIRLVTRAILAVGFTAALAVYVIAGVRPEDPLNEQLTSKKYLHDLEVYGGKANVLAAEFREWFAGIWYGKNLAFTIAALTLLTALVYRFFATPLPAVEEEEDVPEDRRPSRGPHRIR